MSAVARRELTPAEQSQVQSKFNDAMGNYIIGGVLLSAAVVLAGLALAGHFSVMPELKDAMKWFAGGSAIIGVISLIVVAGGYQAEKEGKKLLSKYRKPDYAPPAIPQAQRRQPIVTSQKKFNSANKLEGQAKVLRNVALFFLAGAAAAAFFGVPAILAAGQHHFPNWMKWMEHIVKPIQDNAGAIMVGGVVIPLFFSAGFGIGSYLHYRKAGKAFAKGVAQLLATNIEDFKPVEYQFKLEGRRYTIMVDGTLRYLTFSANRIAYLTSDGKESILYDEYRHGPLPDAYMNL